MKWGGYTNKAADKLTEAIGKIFGAKGLSVLVAIATFALLVSAINKWV